MTAYDKLVLTLVRNRAAEWRALRAWDGRCIGARLTICGPRPCMLGRATAPGEADIYLRPGQRLTDAEATVLHELAHLAAGLKAGHGPTWRHRLAAATEEVTGGAIDLDVDVCVVDAQVRGALERSLENLHEPMPCVTPGCSRKAAFSLATCTACAGGNA